ncbi:MAG: nicotinate (nicotinamide) nucleotide adenylyltransferase [Dysgonamonadaceae bacterium]|nr:nicotinate (nicotinamide) nucleotide adenylyltransferase [Dysgonamonadaceae bacterium]MDD4727894.1 nicotinate (nicotinamide) nucleotide adenylyltransferase [Dysgonamonadaceae bacterium]
MENNKKQIGVFSGSFNPIHIAHLILANYITEFTYIDEVWFVVSPHNPLKSVSGLADEKSRLDMCKIALQGMEKMKVSEIEFSMPRPSFTINTLDCLNAENPEFEFTLIIGADNWNELHLWKSFERLRREFKILIYPRLGENVKIDAEFEETVKVCEAPVIEISSSFIRGNIKDDKNLVTFLPYGVYDYIIKNRLYQ